jgi:5-methylcytosine-specific restriction endonuclease McrA
MQLLHWQQGACAWCRSDLAGAMQRCTRDYIIPGQLRVVNGAGYYVLACTHCVDERAIAQRLGWGMKVSPASWARLYLEQGARPQLVALTKAFSHLLTHPRLVDKYKSTGPLRHYLHQQLGGLQSLRRRYHFIHALTGYEQQLDSEVQQSLGSPLAQDTRRQRIEHLLGRQGMSCVWCSSPMVDTYDLRERRRISYEHVVPRYLGGGNSRENLVFACDGCNNLRGDAAPADWAQYLLQRGEMVQIDVLVATLDDYLALPVDKPYRSPSQNLLSYAQGQRRELIAMVPAVSYP